jgi:DNA-binding NarL/FixJ family response regulator
MMQTTTRRSSGRLSAVPELQPGLDCLTRREREVLALIAAGWSNEGIRDALCLSPKTVESHVHSIFLKLGLRRGTQMHARVLATRAWMSAQSSLPGMVAVRRAV